MALEPSSPPRRNIRDEVPSGLRSTRPPRLSGRLSEAELSARLLELAAPNTHCDEAVCFLGAGAYDHYVPAIVEAVAESLPPVAVGPDAPAEFLALAFDLQLYWQELSGLPVALAPLPDGPQALVAALRTAARATGRRQAVVARSMNPAWRQIAQTLAPPSLTLREVGYHGGLTRPSDLARLLSADVACVVVEHPNFFGCLENVASLAEAAHSAGALLVVKVDPISLGVLRPLGELGADIALADAQPLGSRPACGGNSLGLLACAVALAGATQTWRVVENGAGYAASGETAAPVLASHLARPALYLAAVGGEGLARAAALSARMARQAQRAITALDGFEARFRAPFFRDFVVECQMEAEEVADALLQSNILGGLPLQRDYPEMENCLGFAATERRTAADIELLRHTLELLAEGDLADELGGEGDHG